MIDCITYIVLFGSILFLIRKGELSGKKRLIYCGYFILFIISFLRYDIGNDYANYWLNTEVLVNQYHHSKSVLNLYDYMDGRFEIGFCFLVSLFSWSNHAFFWISAVFSSIFVWSLYYVFKRHNCHFWGMALVIISEYVFLQWDWIRQSGSLSFVLLALLCAKDKDVKHIILYILIASLFHKSAIFMLLAYPLVYVKMNNRLIFTLLMMSLLVYWSGLLDNFVNQLGYIFSYVDGYDKYDLDNIALSSTHTTIFSRIRLTVFVCIGSLIALKLNEEHYFYRNVLTIGLIIYMLSGSTLLLIRIAWYFIIVVFPCFGILMRNKSKDFITRIILPGLVLLQTSVLIYDVATDTNTRGCVPYKSVFSDDFANHQFDVRDYK